MSSSLSVVIVEHIAVARFRLRSRSGIPTNNEQHGTELARRSAVPGPRPAQRPLAKELPGPAPLCPRWHESVPTRAEPAAPLDGAISDHLPGLD